MAGTFGDTRRRVLYNAPVSFMSVYAWFLTVVTWALIFLGGLVTSSGTGLSIPDWPRAQGRWLPPLTPEVRFEYFHRFLAGSLGILVLILLIWVSKSKKPLGIKLLVLGAFLLLLCQGLLGGITVLQGLPKPISILHALLAQTFFVFMVAFAFLVSQPSRAEIPAAKSGRKMKSLSLLTFFFVYFQLVTGALMRHGLSKALFIHILGAILVLIHAWILWAVSKRSETGNRLQALSFFMAIAATAQFALGLSAFYWTWMVPPADAGWGTEVAVVTFHQSLGALLLGLSLGTVLHAFRLKSAPSHAHVRSL